MNASAAVARIERSEIRETGTGGTAPGFRCAQAGLRCYDAKSHIFEPRCQVRDTTMDFELSEEQRAIADTARAFARDEMMPFAREWDEEEFFPVETLRRGAALGFGGI